MAKVPITLLSGEVLENETELTLRELSRRCSLPADQLVDYVEQGLIEPRGREPMQWRFSGTSVRRVRFALRLEQDLGVNPAGAALALDLLEELARARERLNRLEV